MELYRRGLFAGSWGANKRVTNMTIDNDDRRRLLFSQDIECPVCEKIAHSFRLLPGNTLRAPAGEFYHGATVCAGAILADTPAALTLQRAGWARNRSRPSAGQPQ